MALHQTRVPREPAGGLPAAHTLPSSGLTFPGLGWEKFRSKPECKPCGFQIAPSILSEGGGKPVPLHHVGVTFSKAFSQIREMSHKYTGTQPAHACAAESKGEQGRRGPPCSCSLPDVACPVSLACALLSRTCGNKCAGVVGVSVFFTGERRNSCIRDWHFE